MSKNRLASFKIHFPADATTAPSKGSSRPSRAFPGKPYPAQKCFEKPGYRVRVPRVHPAPSRRFEKPAPAHSSICRALLQCTHLLPRFIQKCHHIPGCRVLLYAVSSLFDLNRIQPKHLAPSYCSEKLLCRRTVRGGG